MKNILFFIFFSLSYSGISQFSLTLGDNGHIIDDGYTSVFLVFENILPDYRSITWRGPNGFTQTGVWTGRITTPGEYCVTIISNNYCVAESCIEVKACLTVEGPNGTSFIDCGGEPAPPKDPPLAFTTGSGSANSLGSTIAIESIYPNPFNNQISVSLDAETAQAARIRLLNNVGGVVLNTEIELSEGENVHSFNVGEGLPEGMYIFSVIDEQGIPNSIQVIKGD